MRRLVRIASALLAVALGLVLSGAGPAGSGAAPASGAGSTYLVRAIFDNAAFAVPGEVVRIAGAPVGRIQSLSVTRDEKAAVTLAIDDGGFVPFHADASCRIRPQSLIAERYVDCQPGTTSAPALLLLRRGPGAGSHLLPVDRTSASIDPDVVQNISQEPLRERLSVILNELGTGLAARGGDLNAVIHRADPSLGYTDQVFQILARQNRVLARLAADGDAVLAPLVRVRGRIEDFIVQANRTAVASAARARDISRSFELLPRFLGQLRPLMVALGRLSDHGTPLMADLARSAQGIDRQFAKLIPFARAAGPALIALGRSARASQPDLVASMPLASRLNRLGTRAAPAAAQLDRLTSSLDRTGAIEQLMAVLFYGTGATNGFDADGHFVRTEPLVGSCTAYSKRPVPGCSANFTASASTASADASAAAASVARRAVEAAGSGLPSRAAGLLGYLIGRGR